MPPASGETKPMYAKDEKVLCFHGELLYEAKILDVRKEKPGEKNSPFEYHVHYKGWKNTWDDWVYENRCRKLTDDNRELAANLKRDISQRAQALKPTSTSKPRKGGSEFDSGRPSEERHSSVPVGGRGTKRARDNDIEKVGDTESAFDTFVFLARDRMNDLQPGLTTGFGFGLDGTSSAGPTPRASKTSPGKRTQRDSTLPLSSPGPIGQSSFDTESSKDDLLEASEDELLRPRKSASQKLNKPRLPVKKLATTPPKKPATGSAAASTTNPTIKLAIKTPTKPALKLALKTPTKPAIKLAFKTPAKPALKPTIKRSTKASEEMPSLQPYVRRSSAIAATKKMTQIVKKQKQRKVAQLEDSDDSDATEDDMEDLELNPPLPSKEPEPKERRLNRPSMPLNPKPSSQARRQKRDTVIEEDSDDSELAIRSSRREPASNKTRNLTTSSPADSSQPPMSRRRQKRTEEPADDLYELDTSSPPAIPAAIKQGRVTKMSPDDQPDDPPKSHRQTKIAFIEEDEQDNLEIPSSSPQAEDIPSSPPQAELPVKRRVIHTSSAVPLVEPPQKRISKKTTKAANKKVSSNTEAAAPGSRTAEEILAAPAPPNEKEYLSHATWRAKPAVWAPLLGGTSMDERNRIESEMIESGDMQSTRPRYHAKFVETKQDDPHNLNKLAFYQGVKPGLKLAIAGIPKEPFVLDPPGSGGPFDALKHPKQLLECLDSQKALKLYEWTWNDIRKIPYEIMAQVDINVLATYPREVVKLYAPSLIDRLPGDSEFFKDLPSNSKYKREEHRATKKGDGKHAEVQSMMDVDADAGTGPQSNTVLQPNTQDEMAVDVQLDTASHVNVNPKPDLHTDMDVDTRSGTDGDRIAHNAFAHPSNNQAFKPVAAGHSVVSAQPTATGPLEAAVTESLDASVAQPSKQVARKSSKEPNTRPLPLPSPFLNPANRPGKFQKGNDWAKYHGRKKAKARGDDGENPVTCWSHYDTSINTGPEAHDSSAPEIPQVEKIPTRATHWKVMTPSTYPRKSSSQSSKPTPLAIGTTEPSPQASNATTPDPTLGYQTYPDTPGSSQPEYFVSLQEENFATRPSVRIPIPDYLKNILVDDWENVTKSLLLVPLPAKAPANFIIDTYYDEEKIHRREGSAEADILLEFVTGLKVYFEKSVGKILLYRFERSQLAEVRKYWESGKYPEWEGRGPGDCYGAEHLTRMIVNLPELIAQTNMDVQAVSRLKEEITRFSAWLARNAPKFFVAKYEKPSVEYLEGAR